MKQRKPNRGIHSRTHTPIVAPHIHIEPQEDMAIAYAIWLLKGKPQPQGRPCTKVQPPLYWLPQA